MENIAEGNATITVTTIVGSHTATCSVNAFVPEVEPTGVTLDQSSFDLEVNSSLSLVATVAPANATDKSVTWQSSNASIVSVDQTGKVTAIASGNATIKVTTQVGDHSATCAVNAYVSVTGVELVNPSLTMKVGETKTLSAQTKPPSADNQQVTWETSDPPVITVDADGNIESIASGSATITVKTADGGFSDSVTIISSVLLSATEEGVHQILLSPNPVQGFLVIRSKSNSNIKSVSITDIQGKVCLYRSLNDLQIELNTSELRSGIYVISIETENNKFNE
ncbi:MAG: Ig-like domain-containing protein [Cyclobacteriaceae bacterium]